MVLSSPGWPAQLVSWVSLSNSLFRLPTSTYNLLPLAIRSSPLENISDSTHLVSLPQPPPGRMKGARNYTGTLYLLSQTLVGPSLITESKYHIQIYKHKTTTVVVFTVSIHTILSPIYIYICKNCTFIFT